jgi:hypothetical protein
MRSSVQQKGQSFGSLLFGLYGRRWRTSFGLYAGKTLFGLSEKAVSGQNGSAGRVGTKLKKETKNYANMKAYSSAFQLAIESVIGKSQEVGAASFFSTELVSLNAEGVTSQSDFDIVAFVVVKRK